MLAHEETIQELELTVNELPIVIQTKIKKLNNRKRMSVKAEKLAEISEESELIADEIIGWFNEQDFEEEEEYEEEQENSFKEVEKPNIVSHVENKEIETKKEEIEEKTTSGWGINTSW